MIYTIENTCGIGRPARVFVDGIEIDKAFYADTKKGVVKHYDNPPRLHKNRKRAISRTKRGSVRVEFI